MSILFIIICILILITSLALTTLVLMQKKQAAGFTAMTGSGSGQSSYWDKNKKNSLESKLELYTKILAIVLAILILASNFIK